MKRKDKIFESLHTLFDETIPEQWSDIEQAVKSAEPESIVRHTFRPAYMKAAVMLGLCAVVAIAAVVIYPTISSQPPPPLHDGIAGIESSGEVTKPSNEATVGSETTTSSGSSTKWETSAPTPPTSTNSTPPPTTQPAPAPGGIVINELRQEIAGARLYIDPSTMYTEQWTTDKVIAYLGRDIRPVSLPSDLSSAVSAEALYTAEFYNDGSMIPFPCFNEFAFEYEGNGSGGPNMLRRLSIHCSKTNEQIGDVIYMFDKDMKASAVNGVNMKIGRRSTDDGSLYVALFQVSGISVQVVAENLTANEFVDSLRSMVR